jgi:SAM-dependent methyltransferase
MVNPLDRRSHWQSVYGRKASTEVSWYTPHLAESLRLIQEVAPVEARILDVGGGASTLVDDLLDAGYACVSVLDVSDAALDIARARLGERALRVEWIAADVIDAPLAEAAFDLWHDRAVFHFLTDEADRRAYVRQLEYTLTPGGHVVLGTFAPDGPTKCSGLDVVRYDASSLARELGPRFTLQKQLDARHVTPTAKQQAFSFCRFRKDD